MTVDREQARREVSEYLVDPEIDRTAPYAVDFGNWVLALLAELEQAERIAKHFEQSAETQHNWVHKLEDLLAQERWKVEQAERERDEAKTDRDRWRESALVRNQEMVRLHSRLAAVPALVEALSDAIPVVNELIGWINTDIWGCVEVEQRATPVWHRMKAALAAYQQANP